MSKNHGCLIKKHILEYNIYFLKYCLPISIVVFQILLCFLFNCQFESLFLIGGLSLAGIFFFDKINKDFLMISYAYLLGFLTYTALSLDNSDLMGWWTIAIVFHTILAMISGTIFAVVVQIQKKPHTPYSRFFAILMFMILASQAYVPPNITITIFGLNNTLVAILIFWGILHFLLCLLSRRT